MCPEDANPQQTKHGPVSPQRIELHRLHRSADPGQLQLTCLAILAK